MKQTTIEEVSAGGVVFRRNGQSENSENQKVGKSESRIEFLIGKHSGYHKWVLPKGLVEKGESQMEAAVREVEEEVGVKANIAEVAPIKIIEYYYFADLESVKGRDAKGGESERRVKHYQEQGGAKTRVHKQVIFFLMEVENDLGQAGWEMEERKWVSYEEGIKLLAFESEKEVFGEGAKALGIWVLLLRFELRLQPSEGHVLSS